MIARILCLPSEPEVPDVALSTVELAVLSPPNLEWRIDDQSIVFSKKIGQGAFGTVWEGTWKGTIPVSIKTLNAMQLDADGDPIYPEAQNDFDKECAFLVALDHPNLLRFLGYGTTVSGQGFIVTEVPTHLIPYHPSTARITSS